MPLNIHPLFLVVVLAVVLIVFGPGKLPEVGGAIGRGIKEFKKATSDITSEVTKAVSETPEPPPGPSQASGPPDSGKADSSQS
ncbi:MAG TPA: twin-arginine translocase TatA/TatE family subunit [Candidatus Acidoferrales bacterium]|nr:twin-arginine translocase TatA/TatE family subunit [Candidatus Acidoferrales bacterium]